MKKVKKIRRAQDGRSMVEMLGVLAIIGVLSIGGIAGYTMAMNRYKANKVIDFASKLSVIAQTGYATDPDNWVDIVAAGYNELGLDYYDDSWGARGGMPEYEVTFHVYDSGEVWAGSYQNGVHKALQSIAGNDAYGTGAGPIIKVP